MSPAVQEIAPDASLLSAARVMCAMHIHRLPVLGAGGAPVGILTSLDIVSALANAMEEAQGTRSTTEARVSRRTP
jgi:CBS domain-containing protein